MSNINLTTGSIKESSAAGAMNTGNIALCIALVLVLVGYGGLVFWKNNLAKNVQSTQGMYTTSLAKFSDQRAKDVVDFQNRLNISEGLLGKDSDSAGNLSILEKYIITGVYIDSYKYDSETQTMTLNCVGDNYNIVAKQIMSFKTAPEFSSVFGGESALDPVKNKVEFTIVLKIK